MVKLKTEPARLIGAFDASGKEDQRVIVVAGFVSKAADWQSFHGEWIARLAEDNLEYFHMVDFAGCRKQFEGWEKDEPRRRRLLGDLVGIIKSHVYRKFASAVQFDQFYLLSKENQAEFDLNPYSLAARTCVAHVYEWRKRENLTHVPLATCSKRAIRERVCSDSYCLRTDTQCLIFCQRKPG